MLRRNFAEMLDQHKRTVDRHPSKLADRLGDVLLRDRKCAPRLKVCGPAFDVNIDFVTPDRSTDEAL